MKLQKLEKEDIVDILHVTEVSDATGEIIEYDKCVLTIDGISKQKNNIEEIKRYKEAHDYIRKEIGVFFFYFYNKMDKIDIPLAHKTRFIYLSSFLGYNTENLVTKIEGKGNVYFRIKRDKLFEILALPDRETRSTILSLTKANVMYKDGNYYNISAEYSIHGENNNVNKGCTRVFIDNIRKLYKATDYKKHKQLYYLFKLLPHVNLENNIVCENVKEMEIYKTIPMTLKDIMISLELNETNSTRWLKEMKKFTIDGNYVVMRTYIDETLYIIINPKLYYGGNHIENMKYIIGLFDAVKINS